MDESTEGEKLFEMLLRPISDAFAFNFDFDIGNFVDTYKNYIVSHDVNFTEAAVIVQNSTNVYRKRVERVYIIINDFTKNLDALVLHGRENEEAAEEGRKGKGSKRKPTLSDDSLEVLPIFPYGENIGLDIDNLKPKIKNVVLNNTLKMPIKLGTSIKVYRSEERQFGLKEEFRMFGPVFLSGLLMEELDPEDPISSAENEESLLDMSYGDDDALRDVEPPTYEMSLDGRAPSCVPAEAEPMIVNGPDVTIVNIPSLNHQDNIHVNGETVNNNNASKRRDRRRGLLRIREMKVKRGEVHKLPSILVDEVEGAKDKNGIKVEPLSLSGILFHNTVLTGCSGCINLKMKREQKNMNANLLKRRMKKQTKEDLLLNEDDIINGNGHFSDEELDDRDDDIEDEPLPDFAGVLGKEDDEVDRNESIFKAETRITIEEFNIAKKRIAEKATELEEKVLEWHESIKLKLKNARRKFDVIEYVDKILASFPEPINGVPPALLMSDLVKDNPREENCRYFFSILNLTNTSNIEIVRDDSLATERGLLPIRLLSKMKHTELIDQNLAGESGARSQAPEDIDMDYDSD